ncbi:spermatogenesis-associated protein 48-like [Asterias rubens]|uniref:spermatogenesis-associated protein 48-like n=1 Tax=Asterias rubens TaxID=7604 RepID=UPI0014550A22|nr:spermatogenesis-associated protein 48-like [Asterias rubens]
MVETAVRPYGDLRLHLQTDTNAGPNSIQQVVLNRQQRQMKFPHLRGRWDVDSFQWHSSPNLVKYHDDTLAPLRDNVPTIDPVSGFVSAATDVDRNTGINRIPSLQQVDNTPNTVTPQSPRPTTTRAHRGKEKEKDNGTFEAKKPVTPHFSRARSNPEMRLVRSESDVTHVLNDPGTWAGRKISDGFIRAKLGGWTSKEDPRQAAAEQTRIWKQLHERNIKNQVNSVDRSPDWKDEAALRYVYTSAAQRASEDVSWDSKLAPKVLPPASTLESQADAVSHRFSVNKRYDPNAGEWQNLGRSFDWFQKRDGHHTRGPIDFCSPHRKNNQIPNYTGCIGGEGEREDPHRFFIPSTELRTLVPKYTETARRSNIPGYTGCTHWCSDEPANMNVGIPQPQTTARVHRSLPARMNRSPHKRTSRMSRMVTLVPPGNPFNTIDRDQRTLEQYH